MDLKTVPLVVTPHHVQGSRRGEARKCPVHRALRDQYGLDVEVTSYRLSGHDWSVGTPVKLGEAIDNFDEGKRFRTGVYFIDLPEELASK